MLRFSNRLLSLSALVLMLGTGAAQAQKFAIINMQQAVLLTTDGKKASAAINAKFTPVKAEIDRMAKDIQAKQDAFTKNRATLSPSAATAAQAEIQDLTTKLQRRQQEVQRRAVHCEPIRLQRRRSGALLAGSDGLGNRRHL